MLRRVITKMPDFLSRKFNGNSVLPILAAHDWIDQCRVQESSFLVNVAGNTYRFDHMSSPR